MTWESNPERDKRLAARPRLGWRGAEPLAETVGGFLGSEEMARIRRFQRVTPVLREVLGETLSSRVKPLRLQAGVLTVEVADGPAMHELRQHFAHSLAAKLAAAGTGVSRITWRLASR
jgi:predicted nucleic acid-binding Zn ribbon protein